MFLVIEGVLVFRFSGLLVKLHVLIILALIVRYKTIIKESLCLDELEVNGLTKFSLFSSPLIVDLVDKGII